MEFAQQNISILPNSVKLTFTISSWPFAAIRNQLQVRTLVNAQDSQCKNYDYSADTENLQWVALNTDGYVSYFS